MNRKQPYSWNIRQICGMIDKGTITFDNPNQRPSGQWDSSGSTLLVDSLFRMFVPDIIALQKQEEINGKLVNVYDVIDGKQRLTLLYDFRRDLWNLGEMAPITLESTSETFNISGLKFSELPKEVRDEIDGFTLVIRPIELEDGEDEEEVVNMVMYRLNNGKPMTREHLALLAAPAKVREYVQNTVKENVLFTEKAHFPDGGIKRSAREMAVMQSLIIAGGYEYESYVTKHVEKALANVDIEDSIYEKVNQAFEIIATVFDERNKFISKVNIPSFVNLLINNNFDERVVSFIRDYSKHNKKDDPYRRYSGGTKKSDVEGRFRGLQTLFEKYTGGVIVNKEGQAELVV